MLHSTTVTAFLLEFTEEVGFYHINRWYYCPINRRFISFSLLSIAALDPAAHHCTPLPTIAPTVAPTRPTTVQPSALHCAFFLPLHPKPLLVLLAPHSMLFHFFSVPCYKIAPTRLMAHDHKDFGRLFLPCPFHCIHMFLFEFFNDIKSKKI